MPAQWGVSFVLPSALKQLKHSVNALHAYTIFSAYCISLCESKCVVGERGGRTSIPLTSQDDGE